MNRRKGFTLVELLVVIAIIALLMSILMPALARVRKQAKAVLCQSILKQWSMVFSMYTGDNENYFGYGWPSGYGKVPGIGHGHRWMETLKPYYKDEKLCNCPMTSKPFSEGGQAPYASWGIFEGDWLGGYGLNEWTSNPPDHAEGLLGTDKPLEQHWRSTSIKRAATVPLFLDSWWPGGYPRYEDEPPEFPDFVGINMDLLSGINEMNKHCIDRHENGFINGLFVDMSVRTVGLKELWKLNWYRGYPVNDPSPNWPEWMRRFPEPEM